MVHNIKEMRYERDGRNDAKWNVWLGTDLIAKTDSEASAHALCVHTDVVEALRFAYKQMIEMGKVIRKLDDKCQHQPYWYPQANGIEYVSGDHVIAIALAKADCIEGNTDDPA